VRWHLIDLVKWLYEKFTVSLDETKVGRELKTEPPPTKVEGFSGLERLRRIVGSFPTEAGGFKPDFWKVKFAARPRHHTQDTEALEAF
jgi:hypothetical protein